MAAPGVSKQQRVVTVKLALSWRDDGDRAVWQRLRDLGWQAARYRNQMLRGKWAQAMGYRAVARAEDKAGVSKDIRKTYKEELSGDAYSCAEQEAQALWTRHAKHVLAGAPLPEVRTDAALSISGREKWQDSGIRVERDGGGFVLALRVQAATCEGGGWLRMRLAQGSRRDDFLGPLLEEFAAHRIPVKKATVHVHRSEVLVRLTYPVMVPLSPMGERKDAWDLIRRRVMLQLGKRKGHARRKRAVLARLNWDDWLTDHLHRWTADVADWCVSQGVGAVNVIGLETLDWPAFRFRQMLKYKLADEGIRMTEDLADGAAGTERAAAAELKKRAKEAKRRQDAVRELADQLSAV